MIHSGCCPSCGQLIAPANPFEGRPVKARIYEYVSKHPGRSRMQIADAVYADDPDGGALDSTISVHIHWMNVKLAKLGLIISASRKRGYRLVPLVAHNPYEEGVAVTGALVREIKELYPAVRSHRKLAKQLGTSVGTVQRVLSGQL